MEREIKLPGPHHPIAIEACGDRVRVIVDGVAVADSRRTLLLSEGGYAPVHYFPREDVDMRLLSPSSLKTWCGYKGEASYFSIPSGGERAADAVWTYEAPHDAVRQIAGHLAFYPSRVDAILRAG